MKHGCYDHPKRAIQVMVQAGWTVSGARLMVDIPNRMSKECMYDQRATDPGCAGCKWVDSTSKEQK